VIVTTTISALVVLRVKTAMRTAKLGQGLGMRSAPKFLLIKSLLTDQTNKHRLINTNRYIAEAMENEDIPQSN